LAQGHTGQTFSCFSSIIAHFQEMAVVVKNTFLDVAEHKFLFFDEPCRAERRYSSVPRKWKPATSVSSAITPSIIRSVSKASNDSSTQASPRSELSFFSAVASSEHHSAGAEACTQDQLTDPSDSFRGSSLDLCNSPSRDLDLSDAQADVESRLAPSSFQCMTPTSSQGSPRELMRRCLSQEGCLYGNDGDRTLCYLSAAQAGQCHCNAKLASARDGSMEPVHVLQQPQQASSGNMCKNANSVVGQRSEETEQEPEKEPEICTDCGSDFLGVRAKLETEVPVFKPVQAESQMDAVANAVRMALVSSGEIRKVQVEKGKVKVEKGILGKSAESISAELHAGPNGKARCYDTIQRAKRALDTITERLPNVTLLSARLQKEESGYSLRSAIACIPSGSEDGMCWDLFKKGHCPRRTQCRWNHPQASDTCRLKISIRFSEDLGLHDEKQELDSSPERQKILLGDLV